MNYVAGGRMGKGFCMIMSSNVYWCCMVFFSLPKSRELFQTFPDQSGNPTCVVKRQLHDRSHRLDACGHHLSEETKHTSFRAQMRFSSAFHSLRFSALFLKLWIHRSMETKNTHSPVTSLTVTALSFWTRSLGLWPLQVGVKQPLLVRRPCAHVSEKGSRKAQVAQDNEHSISDNAQTDQQWHSLEWDFSSKDIKEPVQV